MISSRIAEAAGGAPQHGFRRQRGGVVAGHEDDLLGQRGVVPRHLAAGRRQHVEPHLEHDVGDRPARRARIGEERLGERAVAAGAIGGRHVGQGGQRDELVGRHRNTRKAVALAQRILLAGIDEDEERARHALGGGRQRVERHAAVDDIVGVGELGIDRDEIVAEVELQPVPRVIEERDVGAAGGVGKIGHRRDHAVLVEILL